MPAQKLTIVPDEGAEEKVPVLDDQQIKAVFTQALEKVPEDRIPEFLDMVKMFAENAEHEPIKPLPTNKDELKAAGIELYPDFAKRTGEASGLKCLEENYAPWLKYSTPTLDRDYMSQADLKKLDPQLLARLKNQYNGDELNEYLPSITNFNNQLAKLITKEEKKELEKLHSIIYRSVDVA